MKKMIVCNHKMFLSRKEAEKLKFDMESINFSDIDLIVCPSFINFDLFKTYKLGSQDCFYENKGPYTAEISCSNLHEIGVKYSIVGHPYRRKSDSDGIINLKIKSLLDNDMIPILCIGETKQEYEQGTFLQVLEEQIKECLKNISIPINKQIVIAYEPAWTIGSGNAIKYDTLNLAMEQIKNVLFKMKISNYKLIYGGSVTYESLKELIKCDNDGFLLGSSSVNIDELRKIVDYTKKV